MPRFGVERERRIALDALAADLDQRVSFAAYRSPAVAIPAARVLHDDLVGSVLHDNPAAGGLTVANLDELASIAHANRLVMTIAYVLRCNSILAAMRQMLVSGRFGRPVELVAVTVPPLMRKVR